MLALDIVREKRVKLDEAMEGKEKDYYYYYKGLMYTIHSTQGACEYNLPNIKPCLFFFFVPLYLLFGVFLVVLVPV